jgi:DnaJ-domain-containing protein 1
MMDYFALLHLPRQAWLDEAVVKQEFLAQSASSHPDRVHNEDLESRESAQESYLNLNAAYQCLRDSRQRLRHFLELQRGTKLNEIQSVPNELVTLFMEVSRLCREADTLIAQNTATQSPLLKAALLDRNQSFMEELDGMKSRLSEWRKSLEDNVKELNAESISTAEKKQGPASALLGQLDTIQHQMGYAGRWFGQIQERMLKLSF